jgi:hypothetical protein
MMQKQFLLTILGGALLGLCLGTTVQAESWSKDPISGCQIWSEDDGSDGEVVTWTGSCQKGKAIGLGVLVVHDKKGLVAVYNGEMLDGKADGVGSFKFRSEETGDFDHYLGDFKESRPQGNGIYYSSEGWSFQADFTGAFDSGYGTLRVVKDDTIIRGEFKNGLLIGSALASYQTENGEYYFGDIEKDRRHGVGTLVLANDDAYIGDFENGVASGIGAYESANGGVVIGQFAKGDPNGAGSYLAPNGVSYQGIFNNGKPDGKVLVTQTDGSQTVENWKNGEKQK